MTIEKDLRPAYLAMCTVIDEKELDGELATHPELFLKLRLDSTEK
jgi:hypothetical protein